MSPEPVNGGEPWTDADRDRLANLYFTVPKPSIEVICGGARQDDQSRLHRDLPHGHVEARREAAGLLACRRSFYSSWIGERICGFCKSSELMRCA
jgi:hypothetical protein